jgi:hypothetical protein
MHVHFGGGPELIEENNALMPLYMSPVPDARCIQAPETKRSAERFNLLLLQCQQRTFSVREI